jgi:hypothetical protein
LLGWSPGEHNFSMVSVARSDTITCLKLPIMIPVNMKTKNGAVNRQCETLTVQPLSTTVASLSRQMLRQYLETDCDHFLPEYLFFRPSM